MIRPSGESTWPISSKPSVTAGVISALTPPAIATSHSPLRSACTAWWVATSELEHAVSTATDGPWKSKKYETRLATIELAVPVMAYGWAMVGSDIAR